MYLAARCHLGSIAFGRCLGDRSPCLLAIIMASDRLSTLDATAPAHGTQKNNQNMGCRLHGFVLFLLPCAAMSALRRGLLEPRIRRMGGAVTTDPGAATHCVMAIPLDTDTSTHLLTKYGIPASCELVQESFLSWS
jgi:hypothetical protein